MNSSEILDQQFRSMFSDYLPKPKSSVYTDDCHCFDKQPERPIDPPYKGNTSIDMAERHLRKSLTAGKKSEYWDDFVMYLRDEVSDDEADRIAEAALEGESLVINDIMLKVKERAIRKTAERFVDQLGVVS